MEKTELKNKHHPIHHSVSDYYLPTILILGVVLLLFIVRDNPAIGVATEIEYSDLLIKLVGYAVLACELMAALIIALSALSGLISYLRHLFDREVNQQIRSSESIRLRLGYKLSLALEFAVAADILRLAISPKVSDVIVVFAIILLRILMNFFLEHDIQHIRDCNVLPELGEEHNCPEEPKDD